MNSQPARILIIDDEQDFLHATGKLLRNLGYAPESTADPDFALELIDRQKFDLVLCDLQMPHRDGLDMLAQIRMRARTLQVVIISAYGTIDRAVACMKAGAFEFIEKPFEADHLKVIIDKALAYAALVEERNQLLSQLKTKYRFENIIGRSEPMERVFKLVESVADSDANILITGESGTGKELIARGIHARSKRRTKPFVPVNCSALPETLFESEVFGYEKGAFTGADQTKIGLLEHANGGTFLLDEVAELARTHQAKLLRVLQERELRRVGGTEQIALNVRIISVTNRDVEQLVRENLLREDLYYRLNVVNIHLPPLRNRSGDISLLAQHFLAREAKATRKEITGFEPDTLLKLEQYDWPGNVRELENAIERAVALCTTTVIQQIDLPGSRNPGRNVAACTEAGSLRQAKQQAVDEVELCYLTHLIEKHQGNITNVAREAGMTRRNTYLLVKKHAIDLQIWRKQE